MLQVISRNDPNPSDCNASPDCLIIRLCFISSCLVCLLGETVRDKQTLFKRKIIHPRLFFRRNVPELPRELRSTLTMVVMVGGFLGNATVLRALLEFSVLRILPQQRCWGGNPFSGEQSWSFPTPSILVKRRRLIGLPYSSHNELGKFLVYLEKRVTP